MPRIKCFNGASAALKQEFESRITEGMSEVEQRMVGSEIIAAAHSKLITDLNALKTKIDPKFKAPKLGKIDKSAEVKAIQENYQKQIDDLSKGGKPLTKKPVKKPVGNPNFEAAPKAEGRKTSIRTPDGTKIEGQYKVVSADDVLASHNEESFSQTENFPTTETGTTVNDRDYGKDRNAQGQVVDMASNLDGRAITDTPVVDSQGIVLSGNNRTMSRKLAASNGTDATYLDELNDKAEMYGVDPEAIKGIKNPMLIFQPNSALPYTTETFAKFNKATGKEKGPIEKAIEIAKTITDKARRQIANVYESATKQSDITSDPKSATELKDVLIANNIIDQKELPRYFDVNKRVFTKEGVAFLENLLMGGALNEGSLRALDAERMGDIRKKVIAAAVQLTSNSAMGDNSLAENISNAINLANEVKKSNLSLEEFISQGSLFGDKNISIEDFVLANSLLNGNFKSFLENYNANVGSMDMFAMKERSKRDIVNDQLNKDYGTKANQIRKNLESDPQRGTGPGGQNSSTDQGTEGKNAEAKSAEVAKAKTLANKVRAAKINGDGKAFDVTLGLPVSIWNGAVETVATAIEAGASIADAIKRGIKYIEKKHRGLWNKRAYNDKVIEELGLRGIRVNGEDLMVKPLKDKATVELVNGFYSPIEKGISESKSDNNTGKEWSRILTGVTEKDELIFTGLGKFLNENANKVISKQELSEYMKDNRIEIVEVQRGVPTKADELTDEQLKRLDELEKLDAEHPSGAIEDIESGSYDEFLTLLNIRDRSSFEDLMRLQKEAEKKAQAAQRSGDKKLANKLWDDSHRFTARMETLELSAEGEGGIANPTKFSQYQLGGESSNYKEVLVTLPNAESRRQELVRIDRERPLTELEQQEYKQLVDVTRNKPPAFKSSHFDEPNILVHLRMNTRTDSEGKKVLFLEEVQSDWGQTGKREGFSDTKTKHIPIDVRENEKGFFTVYEKGTNNILADNYFTEQAARDHYEAPPKNTGTPSAPFVTDTNSWTKLAFKVALKEAVAQKADKIAWTTGEQQNERYRLEKSVDKIEVENIGFGIRYVKIYSNGESYNSLEVNSQGIIVKHAQWEGKKLDDVVGKGMSDKIMSTSAKETTFEGNDLKVGGKGMKGFYGSPAEGNLGILGNVAKALFKQEPKVTDFSNGLGFRLWDKKTKKYLGSFKGRFSVWDQYGAEKREIPKDYKTPRQVADELGYVLNDVDVVYVGETGDELGIREQHTVDITPSLRDAVKNGLPLFTNNIFANSTGDQDAKIISNAINPLPALMGAINRGQERYIAKNTRKVEDWIAAKANIWLQSKNYFVRNAGQLANSIYNGIARSKENLTGKLELRGGLNTARYDAAKLMENLYAIVGGDLTKVERVHQVIDPEFYIDQGITPADYNSLSKDEQMLHDQLRSILDEVHRRNFALGFIDQATYDKFNGIYSPRLYETHEIPNDVQDMLDNMEKFSAVSKLDLGQFKTRKELEDLSQKAKDDLLKDPVYGAVKRLMQLDQNAAITGYINQIMRNTPNLVLDSKTHDRPKGYRLMSGKGYGRLDGKYVPNYIAEDFKGFFMLNDLLNKTYDLAKAYDKIAPRQLLKKSYTVYNPVVQLGNFVSNFTFAFSAGIDPVTFATNMPRAYKELFSEGAVFRKLMQAGILGSDTVTSDLLPAKAKQGMRPTEVGPVLNALRGVDNFATKAYQMSDDMAKMNAYLTFKDQGFTDAEAIQKVYEGFQNYATVGKMWDFASKVPFIGQPFIKFQADLFRIMKNGVTKTPITTAMYLASLYAMPTFLQFAGLADKEDDDKKSLRTTRDFIPKVPLGFMDIPLVYQTKFGEVNLARYLSPFYLFDTGNSESVYDLAKKVLPVSMIETEEVGKGNTSISPTLADPLLGTLTSALFADKDFRGKSIKDPESSRYRTSGATIGEQIENKLTYLARSWVPQGSNIHDFYLNQKYGEDFYGRTRTTAQGLMNIIVKVQDWKEGDYKNEALKRLDVNLSRIKSNKDDEKNIQANFIQKVQAASKDYADKKITKNQFDNRMEEFERRAKNRLDANHKETVESYQDLEKFVTKYQKFLFEPDK